MKINLRLLAYFLLLSVFAFGVIIQKNEEKALPIVVSTEKVVTTKSEPLSISSKVKAKKVSSVLSAASQRVFVTDKGDDLLVLINKAVRLPETYEPGDLQTFGNKVPSTNPAFQLRKQALNELAVMAKEAKKSGVNLIVSSAYRSYWSQQATFQQRVAFSGQVATETFSARPGHSQHQLGTTVDFDLSDPRAVTWLEKNSYIYGYVIGYPKGKQDITGYVYEPWHYRFIGAGNAIHMMESGLILEEYLREFGVW